MLTLPRPWILYIAGNNGSGKSTLGALLAGRLAVTHLPEDRFDTSYLADQFQLPERWAFEAQAHFLSFKVAQVKSAIASGSRVIIDRSPYEDAEVFAQYYYESGRMDARAYRTYRLLYQELVATLPSPDLIVYCSCPVGDLVERIQAKEQDYERFRFDRQIEHLQSLYEAWLRRVSRSIPGRIFEIATGGRPGGVTYSIEDVAQDLVLINQSRRSASPAERIVALPRQELDPIPRVLRPFRASPPEQSFPL
jgi:deoxyadenosine/deoxycytidine kinase